MEHYSIKGMSCAACSARVEKAVSGVAGVTECSVNLLTNSMTVEGTADSKAIEKAVRNAGYGIKKKGAEKSESDESDSDGEIKQLKKRLIWSVVFLVILMYFSMGHMMWGFPLPAWFDGNHIAMGLVQLILAGIIMVINQKFFISGFKALANLCAEYGHTCGFRLGGFLYLECLRSFCHERRTGFGRYAGGYEIYGRILF